MKTARILGVIARSIVFLFLVAVLLASVDLSDATTARAVTLGLISFIGVAFTAVMAVMTAKINASVQREGQNLTALQHEALNAQAEAAERRLGTETAVKAVDLFGTTSGYADLGISYPSCHSECGGGIH